MPNFTMNIVGKKEQLKTSFLEMKSISGKEWWYGLAGFNV